MISLYYNGFIYLIESEPYESQEDTYKRGWYIVKNTEDNYDKVYSKSIMMINKNKGMEY